MNKCDVAISIHIDAAKNRNANHFGVYIVDNGGKAEVLAGALARDIKAITDWSTGGSSNGIRIGKYHIVRETDMPAVIIECNFLSNPIIEKQLNNKMFQVKLAKEIAFGILSYLGVDKVSTPQWKIDIVNEAKGNGFNN